MPNIKGVIPSDKIVADLHIIILLIFPNES